MLEMMSRLLLLNVPGGKGEEVGGRRGERKIDAFRKKLIIPESETSECPEHKVKSNIRNIFVNEKILEQYSVKIYEIDRCFYEHYKKQKYKLKKLSANTYYLELMLILLNIFQPQKLMKKVILTERSYF